MSEFQCRQGHMMNSKDHGKCRICGGRVYTMDGMTGGQLKKQEKYESRQAEREESNLQEDEERED